jgi:hypothetical protein
VVYRALAVTPAGRSWHHPNDAAFAGMQNARIREAPIKTSKENLGGHSMCSSVRDLQAG